MCTILINHFSLLMRTRIAVSQADLHFTPTLTFHNTSKRAMPIERSLQAPPRILCQPKESLDLVHGDVIHLSAAIYLT